MSTRPLVSPRVAALLGLFGTALGVSSAVLPSPWAAGAMLSAATLAFVAGHALPQLKLASGRPLVPVALVGPLSAVSSVLVALAAGMPDSLVGTGMLLAAFACAFLAGKSLEAPARTPLPTTPEESLEVLPVGDGTTKADSAQVRAALSHLPRVG